MTDEESFIISHLKSQREARKFNNLFSSRIFISNGKFCRSRTFAKWKVNVSPTRPVTEDIISFTLSYALGASAPNERQHAGHQRGNQP